MTFATTTGPDFFDQIACSTDTGLCYLTKLSGGLGLLYQIASGDGSLGASESLTHKGDFILTNLDIYGGKSALAVSIDGFYSLFKDRVPNTPFA